jgi:hypothetical protein
MTVAFNAYEISIIKLTDNLDGLYKYCTCMCNTSAYICEIIGPRDRETKNESTMGV